MFFKKKYVSEGGGRGFKKYLNFLLINGLKIEGKMLR